MIAVEQVGGVRRGRDVASHPRLACPMLQPRMPRTTTLRCYIHSTASLHATQNSALPSYAPCLVTLLTVHGVHGVHVHSVYCPMTEQTLS